MQHLIDRLPRFARPFVTRALRGPRAVRFVALSAFLGVLTVLVSAWLTFGGGVFEQQVRIGLGVEVDPTTQRLQHLTVSYRELSQARSVTQARDEVVELANEGRLTAEAWGRLDYELQSAFSAAHGIFDAAALAPPTDRDATPENLERWRAASALLQHGPASTVEGVLQAKLVHERSIQAPGFRWDDESLLARLDRAIARGGIPEVQVYAPGTTLRDGFRVVAYVAISALAFLSLVMLPVMAGTQTAQEAGDGTLSPLRSTALSSREIVLGLAAGPATIAALLAAPQAALYLVGSLIEGSPLHGFVALVTMTMLAVLSTFIAQLVGLVAGQHRSPGLIAVPLTVVSLVALLIGISISQFTEHERAAANLVAACPHANVAVWGFSGAGGGPRHTVELVAASVIGAVALAIFAVVALLALGRRVHDRPGPLLTRGEYAAFAAATFSSTLWACAPELWKPSGSEAVIMALLLAAPVMLIGAAGRIPVGDPSARSTFKWVPTIAELAAPWLVVLVALGVAGTSVTTGPGTWPWLIWLILVLQLVAARSVLAPTGVAGGALLMWTGLTALVVTVEIGTRADGMTRHLFVFSELSPTLGLLEALSLVAVPVLLVASVRPSLGHRREGPAPRTASEPLPR